MLMKLNRHNINEIKTLRYKFRDGDSTKVLQADVSEDVNPTNHNVLEKLLRDFRLALLAVQKQDSVEIEIEFEEKG